jgi:LDH2 family malate/lactate/ureidoglycolate dehydrogenase
MQALQANGVSEDHAGAIADTVTAAERDDCKSHGLFRIPGYIMAVRSGKVTPDAVPELRELAPAVVQVGPRPTITSTHSLPGRCCRTSAPISIEPAR